MKKAIALILFLVTVSLASCTKEVNTVTDFSKLADMERKTDRIDVTFDNYSGYPFYFTIDDDGEIEQVMDIIFNATFVKMGKEVNDGDHTSLKIIQGEKVFVMSVSTNKEGNYYYSFQDGKLQNKIKELATAAGAYEGIAK